MAVRDIYRGTSYDDIQKVFDAAESGDTVVFHPEKEGTKRFGPEPAFDVGTKTIKINKGSIFAPFTLNIVGKQTPIIRGTSPGLMVPADPNAQKPEDCGIFYIGPWCSVDISNLHLVHEIPAYDASWKSGHGSATIANLVDNSHTSFLNISKCTIKTNATAAISVRSDSTQVQSAPGKHNILISGCTVTGDSNTGPGAGNYSSVNLGYWGKVPFDMTANSKFEVSECTLDSLLMGVLVWNVRSDLNSVFRVQENKIGLDKGTALGVNFNCKQLKPGDPFLLPKGTIAILGNTMKIVKWVAETQIGAMGVWVVASDGPQTKITIDQNTIEMALPQPHPALKHEGGIVYEQILEEQAVRGAEGASVKIVNNTVYQAGRLLRKKGWRKTG